MIITLLIFIVVLGLLVFVHEFGHFISAKKMGAKVDEFGFGFPPRMAGVYKDGKKWKWVFRKTPKIDQTIYSVNWIPLGGFVKIKGEEGEHKEDTDSFASKKIWQRAIILVAGVVMNIVLAMVLLGVGYMVGLPRAIDENMPKDARIKNQAVQIVSVQKNSPAQEAGILSGDELIKIDGNPIDFKNMQDYLTTKVGEDVRYTVSREGKIFEKTIVPYILEETGKGGVGIGLIESGLVSYPWYSAVWRGMLEALYFVKEITVAFVVIIKNLIVGQAASIDISGPVGIAVITSKVARLGFIYILQFAAILSINLAILNGLPFPALDGGRLLFLLIEKLRGKPVTQKIENMIHNLGFLLLMILIIVITYNDFVKFGSKFVNLWQTIIH